VPDVEQQAVAEVLPRHKAAQPHLDHRLGVLVALHSSVVSCKRGALRLHTSCQQRVHLQPMLAVHKLTSHCARTMLPSHDSFRARGSSSLDSIVLLKFRGEVEPAAKHSRCPELCPRSWQSALFAMAAQVNERTSSSWTAWSIAK
jgi:hypothetical protein